MQENRAMYEERIVASRTDRELWKKLISPGDYSLVPYEDSRCKVSVSNVTCTKGEETREIEVESRIFSRNFDGMVLIGDSDSFIDRDFEFILQQMCCGEVCEARMVYRDFNNELVKEIKCTIHLKDLTEEQLISDWGWERLYESAIHHKEKGVELVKQKRYLDAFRRFNRGLKMLIAIEPVDPEVIQEEKVSEMVDLKVKLYNNQAHCQLQYNQYDAVIKLCSKALAYQPENSKALYRRSTAYMHTELYEEAWMDIQKALTLDPNDKAIQQKVKELSPIIQKMNKEYSHVIKKMFSYYLFLFSPVWLDCLRIYYLAKIVVFAPRCAARHPVAPEHLN